MRSLWSVAVLLAPSVALAQPNPKFEFGKAEELEKVKEVEWTAAAEAGVVFTTGNSETTTATAGVKASRKTGQNKLALEGSLTYARSALRVIDDQNGNGLIDGENEIVTESSTTAETLAGKLRYDRFLTKYNSLFIAALGARDKPAGKDAVVGGQIGYSRQLYKTAKHEAVGEIGYDFSFEDLAVGDSTSIHSARGFVGYKGELTTGTSLDASVEALTNIAEVDLPTGKDGGFGKDTRINGKLGVSAKIGKNLAVQTTVELKYDHRPGPLALKDLAPMVVIEASSLDTIMKASLIYSFF